MGDMAARGGGVGMWLEKSAATKKMVNWTINTTYPLFKAECWTTEMFCVAVWEVLSNQSSPGDWLIRVDYRMGQSWHGD